MTQQNVVVSDTKSGVSLTVFPTPAQKKPPAAPGGYISISRRRVLKNLEINGDQRINAWVESMRASSPTHLKSTPSFSQEQNSWIVRTTLKSTHFLIYQVRIPTLDLTLLIVTYVFYDYYQTASPPVGIRHVWPNYWCVKGKTNCHVPGLRWHTFPNCWRSWPCFHVSFG